MDLAIGEHHIIILLMVKGLCYKVAVQKMRFEN